MTDRLTPGMLRDLAELCAVGNRVVTLHANGETTRFYPNKDLAHVLREEAARREADVKTYIDGVEVEPGRVIERDGPGSAAAPFVSWHQRVEDKPAPAAEAALRARLAPTHEMEEVMSNFKPDEGEGLPISEYGRVPAPEQLSEAAPSRHADDEAWLDKALDDHAQNVAAGSLGVATNIRQSLRRRLAELRAKIAEEIRAAELDAMTRQTPPGWNPMSIVPLVEDEQILLVTSYNGVTEARFSPGYWTDHYEGREYNGPVWVCGDDEWQIEIEETSEDTAEWRHGSAIGWLPRTALPAAPEAP